MSAKYSSVDSSEFTKDKMKSELNKPLKNGDYNIQYGTLSDEKALIEPQAENQSKCTKLCQVLLTLTIEPVMFCFMYAHVMNLGILPNLMMDLGCRNHFNYSSEVCKNLSGNPIEKKNVEIIASDFSMYLNLISLVGAFFMIFIAPWSDKYGRKLPLLFVLVGFILMDVGLLICVILNVRLEYLLLTKIPSESFGGFICVLTIIYSHTSEVSSEKNRTLKYTAVEIAFGLGVAFGGLTGGFLYRYFGYLKVYITVASLHTFCVVWILLVVEETTGLDVDAQWIEKAKDFFVCKSFKNGIEATFRSREGGKRTIIQLLILSMCIVVITYESFNSIGFVYVHHIFNWDPTAYSIVTTAAMLIQMSATLILVPIFVRIFKIKDFTLGLFGAISLIAKNLIIAFAKYHEYIYYIGQFSGALGQLITLAVRSGISKLVEKDELGKVFSFLATCETIIPMLFTVVFTKVFEATLDIFPSITYSIIAILLLIPLASFIWAFRTKKTANGQNLTDEDHLGHKT